MIHTRTPFRHRTLEHQPIVSDEGPRIESDTPTVLDDEPSLKRRAHLDDGSDMAWILERNLLQLGFIFRADLVDF